MSTKDQETKPLEAARKRIALRKELDDEITRIAEKAIKKGDEARRKANLADAAEMERQNKARQEAWESLCPENLKTLVQDVKNEIETKEGVSLKELFRVTDNENEYSVKITLLGRKTIPGKEKPEPMFFRGKPPEKQTPDTHYNYSFSLKYQINGIIEWAMGNPTGSLAPEVKQEPVLDRMTVTTFILREDPKYAGTFSYSEKNFEELAEALVQHLDQQHYRYQIREKPTKMYSQELPPEVANLLH